MLCVRVGVYPPILLQVFGRFFVQLQLQAGWSEPVVALARALLYGFIIKIANGMKKWRTIFDGPEWNGLFKVHDGAAGGIRCWCVTAALNRCR